MTENHTPEATEATSRDEFTPTTEQVREGYAADQEYEYHNPLDGGANTRENRKGFDRWLAAHDREFTDEITRLRMTVRELEKR